MAPVVPKAKTAFLYYQTEMIGEVKNSLGPGASMGAAMTEVCIVYLSWSCLYSCFLQMIIYNSLMATLVVAKMESYDSRAEDAVRST